LIDYLIQLLQSVLPSVDEPPDRVCQRLIEANLARAVEFEFRRVNAMRVVELCGQHEFDSVAYLRNVMLLTYLEVIRGYRRRDANYSVEAKFTKVKRSWIIAVQDVQFLIACTNGILNAGAAARGARTHDGAAGRGRGGGRRRGRGTD
jgi:t-SNARE complex subunit (syntaxin)